MKSIPLIEDQIGRGHAALAKTGGKVAAIRNHSLLSRFGSKSRWIGLSIVFSSMSS